MYNRNDKHPGHYHPTPTGTSIYPPTQQHQQHYSHHHHHHHHHHQPLSAPPSDGQGYAYSTLLRRADEEPMIRTPYLNSTHPIKSNEPHSPVSNHPTEPTPSAKYSIQSIEQVIQQLSTDPINGLNSEAIQAIREIHGPNEFEVDPKQSIIKKFIAQFYESPLNLLLLGSAGVSVIVGNTNDAISITAAIIIVVTVGFIQEQRSEKSLTALNKLVPHYCHLTRDGQSKTLLANVLVPGDLVHFSVGDRIPADLRLIRTNELEIDESPMTGETKPIKKNTIKLEIENRFPDISERANSALMGTLVKNGNGLGIVVGIGSETEFGLVFEMMKEVEERKTPLQVSMDELAKKLSVISFGVIGIICLIGVLQHKSWLEMFTVGVSLAVAAIPEGLPIVVTVTLALGVLRMSKRKAIVKKLHSVETLGSVSVICSDKTGTLTTNEMTVTRIYTVDDGLKKIDGLLEPGVNSLKLSDVILKTLQVANVCVNAYKNQDGVIIGTSTEVALLNVLTTLGIEDCRQVFNRTSEVPFTSEAKCSSVLGFFKQELAHHRSWITLNKSVPSRPGTPLALKSSQSTANDRETCYLIGAPEVVLARCKFYLKGDSVTIGLDDDGSRSKIIKEAEQMSKAGLRVLAMAYGFDQGQMIFTGLQGMTDPPRRGVSKAIESLQRGGVKVVMITGDSEFTALAIAKELGIKTSGGMSGCLTGQEIDRLGSRELVERVKNTSVFARVTPRHKMTIIEAFQRHGLIVAMTGDGVNDAPALKMADIGISMGKGATDVAKEAADLILVDDNFATILPAIEEGKTIFYNIQNFLAFQLSTAVAALSLITISTILGLQAPLNAMQILFINILMDGPPSQSLGVDPVNREVMKRKPRSKDSSVLTIRLLFRILFSALVIIIGIMFIYLKDLKGIEVIRRDQTMTFTSFVILDLISALQNRGLNVDLLPKIEIMNKLKRLIYLRKNQYKLLSNSHNHHHHRTLKNNNNINNNTKTYNPILLITIMISLLSQLSIVYLPILQGIFKTVSLSLRDLSVLFILGFSSFSLHEFRRIYERKIEREEMDVLTELENYV